MQLTAQRIPLPAAGEKSSETANVLNTLQKRGESQHVGVMFAIYSIEFLRVDIIKATDVECQQKNVWLFVHVLKTHEQPSLAAYALSDVWETWTQQEELPNAREMGCSLIIYFRFA